MRKALQSLLVLIPLVLLAPLHSQTTVSQSSIPTYSLVGSEYYDPSKPPPIMPPGATWRYGSPSCNLIPNNSGWVYLTNNTGAPLPITNANLQFGADPAFGCTKAIYSQDPPLFAISSGSFPCSTLCTIKTVTVDSLASNRIVAIGNGGQYVDTLRQSEIDILNNLMAALSSAQRGGVPATISAAQTLLKAQQDAIATLHGSLDNTSYNIYANAFIIVLNGKVTVP